MVQRRRQRVGGVVAQALLGWLVGVHDGGEEFAADFDVKLVWEVRFGNDCDVEDSGANAKQLPGFGDLIFCSGNQQRTAPTALL